MGHCCNCQLATLEATPSRVVGAVALHRAGVQFLPAALSVHHPAGPVVGQTLPERVGRIQRGPGVYFQASINL